MELLRTDRTIVREWRDDEAERLYDILRRPEVKRWLDDDFHNPELMQSVDEARERIATFRERVRAPGPTGYWAVEEVATGVVAGTVLLSPAGSDPPPDREEVEIGWNLHPDAQGRGLAREAAAALLAHRCTIGLWEMPHRIGQYEAPMGAGGSARSAARRPVLSGSLAALAHWPWSTSTRSTA